MVDNVETAVTYFQLKLMGFNDTTYELARDCRNTLKANGIDTTEEKAHFFAQCYVEGGISLLEAGYLSEEIAEAYRKQRPFLSFFGG